MGGGACPPTFTITPKGNEPMNIKLWHTTKGLIYITGSDETIQSLEDKLNGAFGDFFTLKDGANGWVINKNDVECVRLESASSGSWRFVSNIWDTSST